MRFFVDHGTIHDRETGKHVSTEEAAAMLSALPSTLTSEQRIAWGVVVELGKMLHAAETRIEIRDITLERIREYAESVRSTPLGMETIDPGMVALVEQARRYVADIVIEIVNIALPKGAQ